MFYTGSKYHGLRRKGRSFFGSYNLLPILLPDRDHIFKLNLRSLGKNLVQQTVREFVAAHGQGAGIILYFRGMSDLAPETIFFDHKNGFPVPSGIESSCHAGRSPANYDNIIHDEPPVYA